LIIAGALVAKFGYEPATDGALLIAHGDANADTVPTAGQATTTAETSPAPEGGATACEGDSSGRDAKCGVAKVRKVKSRRAANEGATIAALPLGRTVLLAPEPSAVDPSPTDAANSDVPTPAVADVAGPRAPKKKVRKASRRTGGHDWSREWRLPASQWSAQAYAPDNRYLRGRYDQSWGRPW